MSEQLKQLEALRAELHRANEAFSAASREVDRVSELNLDERELLAARLRGAQAQWEAVTRQVADVLGIPAGAGGETPDKKDRT